MADNNLKFVEQLIGESTLAVRLYFSCTCGLLILTLVLTLTTILKPPSLDVAKTVPMLTSVLSAVPVPLWLLARSKRVVLLHLRGRWADAIAEGDQAEMDKLRVQLEELEKAVLQKG